MSSKTMAMRQPIPLLYEDDMCMVFNKPAKLLVIPSPKQEKKTLTSSVNQQYADKLNKGNLHPCHRLDRDTTGAILYAKGKKNQKILMDLFKQRLVRKKYIAFIQGRITPRQGEINEPLSIPDGMRYARKRKALSAMTKYKVIDFKKGFSVVEVEPLTGRTNQIRIHFKDKGHPILGDRKYSFVRDYDVKFRRTALHSLQLIWPSPETGITMRVSAPWPEDMQSFLKG